MQEINWNCCPLVAQNPITRAFIEQMAKEQKSRSTIENYSRDLNDFLSAFPDIPFSELIEADESRIADYVDWLWKREAKQRAGQQGDRSKDYLRFRVQTRASDHSSAYQRPALLLPLEYPAPSPARLPQSCS